MVCLFLFFESPPISKGGSTTIADQNRLDPPRLRSGSERTLREGGIENCWSSKENRRRTLPICLAEIEGDIELIER